MRYLMFGIAVLVAIVLIAFVVGFVHFNPAEKAEALGAQARARIAPAA